MPRGLFVDVVGERRLRNNIMGLRRITSEKVTRRGLMGAAEVVQAAMRRRLKLVVRERTGRLDRSIVVSNPTPNEARVGPWHRIAPHAHLVEFGTAPRRTKSGAYRGQMPARSFARTGWADSQAKALAIVARTHRRALERLRSVT